MVSVTLDAAAALAAALRRERLLAIVRGSRPDAMLRVIHVLVENGVTLVEVSLTSTDALPVIQRASAELGEAALIGAGTVRSGADADAAHDVGAQFVVTPALVPDAASLPLPAIIGALTPTEITAAAAREPVAVKLFPASLGGPDYLGAVRQPFPNVPFVPVGGVDADSARAYIRRGAIAVGVGGPLLGDAAEDGDLEELASRARAFRAAVSEVES